MMVLSGAMFPFDKLNRSIGSVDKVPLIAELMPTRWTYEALMVTQFKDNRYNRFSNIKYGKTVYDYHKDISIANYYSDKLVPKLMAALEKTDSVFNRIRSADSPVYNPRLKKNSSFGKIDLLRNELNKLTIKYPSLPPFGEINLLTPETYNENVSENLRKYLLFLKTSFSQIEVRAFDNWDHLLTESKSEINRLSDAHNNEKLEDIVTKRYEREKSKILEYGNTLVQNYDPIYIDPVKRGFFGFRTHFFAPSKYIFGYNPDTFTFNILLVLFSTILLILMLYFNLLGRFVEYIENLRLRK
jgi:ABC transport system ATP-binding/permease protein